MFIRKWSARQTRCSISRALDDEIIGTTLPEQARGDAKLLKGIGVPDGIRPRVTAVKGRCPNRWTTGTHALRDFALLTSS